MRKSILPDMHDDIAVAYDNLAGIYRLLGEEELAKEYRLKVRTYMSVSKVRMILM